MVSVIIPNRGEKEISEVKILIHSLYPDFEVIVSNDFQGRGKGWAVREGFKKAQGDTIIFIDADMDIHPKEIAKLLPKLNEYDIVVGKKEIKDLPFNRKLITYFSRKLIKFLFELPISDTQTGLKVFKREAISDWAINGYAFDCEILSDAHHKGFKIGEVPIECKITKKKGLKVLLKTLWETFSLL